MEIRLAKDSAQDLDYPDNLDPGIKKAVKILVDEGIRTFESCEGGEGHVFDRPTIRFHGNSSIGYRALGIAIDWGLPVAELRRVWAMIDGELTGPEWELVFANKLRTG